MSTKEIFNYVGKNVIVIINEDIQYKGILQDAIKLNTPRYMNCRFFMEMNTYDMWFRCKDIKEILMLR